MNTGDKSTLIRDNAIQADKPFQSLLEKQFSYFMSPLETFIHKQTTSGILLVIFSIVAFALSNSPWKEFLENVGDVPLGIIIDRWDFSLSIKDWISQGLMTLFFFLTGLELKREILAGKLTDIKEISLVCAAAFGGIVIPALFYYSMNKDGIGQHGWAIPTATDTAFAIAILALFARRISIGLTIFLTALAIFDDIGAIVIISIFYAHETNSTALIASGLIFACLLFGNKAGIRNGWIYAVMGILLWLSVLQAGIHPTLSGLLLAMTIPARTTISQSRFIKNIRGLLTRFEQKQEDDISMLGSSGKHSLVSDIEQNVLAASTPLQRWEMGLIIPIAIIILPLFALFNAGFPITQEIIIKGLSSSVTIGIIFGLVVGKPIGILLFSYVAIRSGLGRLPYGVRFKDVIGVSMLAGIGFTMSVFFTTLSFPDHEELAELAKLGILIGSLMSAMLGSIWIYTQFPNLYLRKNKEKAL
jgi:NhaA family Na+:H+ antiporter